MSADNGKMFAEVQEKTGKDNDFSVFKLGSIQSKLIEFGTNSAQIV